MSHQRLLSRRPTGAYDVRRNLTHSRVATTPVFWRTVDLASVACSDPECSRTSHWQTRRPDLLMILRPGFGPVMNREYWYPRRRIHVEADWFRIAVPDACCGSQTPGPATASSASRTYARSRADRALERIICRRRCSLRVSSLGTACHRGNGFPSRRLDGHQPGRSGAPGNSSRPPRTRRKNSLWIRALRGAYIALATGPYGRRRVNPGEQLCV